jgi:hypothetical protein
VHRKLRTALAAGAALAALVPALTVNAGTTQPLGGSKSGSDYAAPCQIPYSLTESPEQAGPILAPTVTALTGSVTVTCGIAPDGIGASYVVVDMSVVGAGGASQSCANAATYSLPAGQYYHSVTVGPVRCSISNPVPGPYTLQINVIVDGDGGPNSANCQPYTGQAWPETSCAMQLQTVVFPGGVPNPCNRIACTIAPAAARIAST